MINTISANWGITLSQPELAAIQGGDGTGDVITGGTALVTGAITEIGMATGEIAVAGLATALLPAVGIIGGAALVGWGLVELFS